MCHIFNYGMQSEYYICAYAFAWLNYYKKSKNKKVKKSLKKLLTYVGCRGILDSVAAVNKTNRKALKKTLKKVEKKC